MVDKGIFDLLGKVVLITGGGSGLGRVFCEGMAEFGADVVCVDINREWAEETANLINKFGHRTLVIEADVSKPKDVQRMIDDTVKEFGSLDILLAYREAETPASTEQRHQLQADLTPMGRRGSASELKGLAIYLASDASSFVTGQVFVHDGGWTSW